MSQHPRHGSIARRISSNRPSRMTSPPAQGFALRQWRAPHARHVTGGADWSCAPQAGQ
jgi:hypothetical protein